MSIRTELNTLKSADIYSLMLFALYKTTELPEYSSLSQLSYILDKENLLKLCEFYGGTTIRIPTICELEHFLNALLVFQLVDVEGKNIDEVLLTMKRKNGTVAGLEKTYNEVKQLLQNYNFNSGR